MKLYKKTYLFLIFVTITSICCCGTKEETYHEKLLIEGKNGSGHGEISWKEIGSLPTGPISFAVNSKGSVYILDLLNDKVVKFDSKGKYVASFPQDTTKYLMDIAFDKDNNIYIEYWSGDIAIHDTTMKFKRILDLKGNGHPITKMEVTKRNTILLMDPDIEHGDHIIELDTNGYLLKGNYDLRYYIESKGEYYIREWHSSIGQTKLSDSVYNVEDKSIFSREKLGLKGFEIIGIDSLKNIYFSIKVNDEPKERILKVSPKGKILADFLIRYSSGHADACRTTRVSDAGEVYVLDGWYSKEKFQLWKYYPKE